MTLAITQINDWPSCPQRRQFRIEDERGYCEVTLWWDSHVLAGFGGSVWPNSFPELFEHFGDPGVINCRSGYRLKDGVTLPGRAAVPYGKRLELVG